MTLAKLWQPPLARDSDRGVACPFKGAGEGLCKTKLQTHLEDTVSFFRLQAIDPEQGLVPSIPGVWPSQHPL